MAKLTKRRLFLAVLLLLSTSITLLAEIRVNAKHESLSTVVRRLKLEVSFDEKLLSEYKVTLNKKFASPDDALRYLTADKPLLVTRTAGVYVISAKRVTEVQHGLTHFAVDSASHCLTVSLNEIVIRGSQTRPFVSVNSYDGTTRMTGASTRAFAGYADNAVFNMLRLMPGVRASGGPSDELYVWGSSPGESRVIFDGIPLLAMQSYNSNVSYINPYMAGEVRYKRGELSTADASLIGSVVNVTSEASHPDRAVVKAMLSTLTANVFATVPLSRKVQMAVAYRHTLDGLFGNSFLSPYKHEKDSDKNEGKETLTYDYNFQDANLNLTGSSDSTNKYKVALYGARDYLKYEKNNSSDDNGKRTSSQVGGSAYYQKKWNDGSRSELETSFTGLYSTQEGYFESKHVAYPFELTERVSQCNFKAEQEMAGQLTGLRFGGELTHYAVRSGDARSSAAKPTLFAEQQLDLGSWGVQAGVRTDLMSNGVMWQPRALVRYNFLKYFTLTGSWGIYNQYLVKNPYELNDGYYQFRWDINKRLKSYNTTLSLFFNLGELGVAAEAFSKKIRNSLWIVDSKQAYADFNLKGLDVSVRYNGKMGTAFASWSIVDDPRQAGGVAQEIKSGASGRIGAFSASISYVFGKGYNTTLFPVEMKEDNEEHESKVSSDGTYSRLDLSGAYKVKLGKFWMTAGLSVINVLNRENAKYSTSWMPRSGSENILTQTSKITPIAYLEIKF